jgi:ABC-2 type transport system permease protein
MFLVFMSLAILAYGSIFVAVGAAVSDLKDAQSMITPVTLVAVLPMFAVSAVIKSPGSPLSVGLSLFPPATPFVMLLRAALQPPPPLWQVLLGIVLTAGFALGCIAAAAKIFRIGILSSGKSASFGEMLRWIRAK